MKLSYTFEIDKDSDTLYNLLLHFPKMNIFEAKKVVWKDLSCWYEYNDEFERICKMEVKDQCIKVYIYHSVSMKHYDEVYTFIVKKNNTTSILEVEIQSGTSLLSKLSFYKRKYGNEIVVKRCIEKIKDTLS